MRRLWYWVAFTVVAMLVLAPTARAQGNQQMVSIQDFFFSPAQINVQPGTTVTWTNQGNAPHTVTADDGSFDSETLDPGQSFSHTFQSPGTVGYHCEVHPFMTGSVTVSKKKGVGRGGTATANAGGAKATIRGGVSEARAGGVVARSHG
jgi:plastocyanin